MTVRIKNDISGVKFAKINHAKLATYRNAREAFLEKLSRSKKNRDLYLKVAIEDFEQEKNLPAFLLALRNIVTAGGGVQDLAQKLKLNRQTIYKALSPKGNPSFALVDVIINALGMRLAVRARKYS